MAHDASSIKALTDEQILERFGRTNLKQVRCIDCAHAEIDGGIAKCRAGVDAMLPTQGYWATDNHACPWHFQARDPPDTPSN